MAMIVVLGRNYRVSFDSVIALKLRTEMLAEQLRAEKAVADEARQEAEIANRANMKLFGLKDATAFALSPPPIEGFGTTNGFSFRLQDRSGLGQEALKRANAELMAKAGSGTIVTGLRVSTVQVVATATLGALVGYRDLGTPIVTGFTSPDKGPLLAGALAVALLALVTDGLFALAARVLVPWRRPPGRTADATVTGEEAAPLLAAP